MCHTAEAGEARLNQQIDTLVPWTHVILRAVRGQPAHRHSRRDHPGAFLVGGPSLIGVILNYAKG